MVTIKGSGFSPYLSEVNVYVGGLPCDVKSSSLVQIRCVTRAQVSDTAAVAAKTAGKSLTQAFGSHIQSQRRVGSPGWWIKMWNAADSQQGKTGLVQNVKKSFGWRDRFFISFWDEFGDSSWVNNFGFSTQNYFFSADAAAVFTAPYSGFYTFYVAADDTSKLFGSKIGIGVSETLIAFHNSFVPITGNIYMTPTQRSIPIALRKNEKYYLRYRFVNTGGYDYSTISVRITPAFDRNGVLANETWTHATISSVESFARSMSKMGTEEQRLANFPLALLQHRSLREIQSITLRMEFFRETQVI